MKQSKGQNEVHEIVCDFNGVFKYLLSYLLLGAVHVFYAARLKAALNVRFGVRCRKDRAF